VGFALDCRASVKARAPHLMTRHIPKIGIRGEFRSPLLNCPILGRDAECASDPFLRKRAWRSHGRKARAFRRNQCGELEMKWHFIVAVTVALSIHSVQAEDLGCVSTTFKALSPNDKVCVSVFQDPQVPGVACHISQARKGGWGQPFGLNEDPSNFSVSCRQVGPIDVDLSKLRDNEEVFSQKTSIFFKSTRIYRMVDKPRNTLVYLAISTKIVNGSPANAISTVPIVQWQQ
jgi:CreA protein